MTAEYGIFFRLMAVSSQADTFSAQGYRIWVCAHFAVGDEY